MQALILLLPALQTTLLQLALPLAAQEMYLCPENPPEDHSNVVIRPFKRNPLSI